MDKTIDIEAYLKTDKGYIWKLRANGDRRSYNELAADLQLFRWNARMSGHPEWRYFEDPKLQENEKEENRGN